MCVCTPLLCNGSVLSWARRYVFGIPKLIFYHGESHHMKLTLLVPNSSFKRVPEGAHLCGGPYLKIRPSLRCRSPGRLPSRRAAQGVSPGIYLHVCMWHVLRSQRLWVLWSWNYWLFWDTWHGCWEPNLGLLIEPSLQPQQWKVFKRQFSNSISQTNQKHQ